MSKTRRLISSALALCLIASNCAGLANFTIPAAAVPMVTNVLQYDENGELEHTATGDPSERDMSAFENYVPEAYPGFDTSGLDFDYWDGSTDMSLTEGHAGTKEDPFVLSSAEQLMGQLRGSNTLDYFDASTDAIDLYVLGQSLGAYTGTLSKSGVNAYFNGRYTPLSTEVFDDVQVTDHYGDCTAANVYNGVFKNINVLEPQNTTVSIDYVVSPDRVVVVGSDEIVYHTLDSITFTWTRVDPATGDVLETHTVDLREKLIEIGFPYLTTPSKSTYASALLYNKLGEPDLYTYDLSAWFEGNAIKKAFLGYTYDIDGDPFTTYEPDTSTLFARFGYTATNSVKSFSIPMGSFTDYGIIFTHEWTGTSFDGLSTVTFDEIPRYFAYYGEIRHITGPSPYVLLDNNNICNNVSDTTYFSGVSTPYRYKVREWNYDIGEYEYVIRQRSVTLGIEFDCYYSDWADWDTVTERFRSSYTLDEQETSYQLADDEDPNKLIYREATVTDLRKSNNNSDWGFNEFYWLPDTLTTADFMTDFDFYYADMESLEEAFIPHINGIVRLDNFAMDYATRSVSLTYSLLDDDRNIIKTVTKTISSIGDNVCKANIRNVDFDKPSLNPFTGDMTVKVRFSSASGLSSAKYGDYITFVFEDFIEPFSLDIHDYLDKITVRHSLSGDTCLATELTDYTLAGCSIIAQEHFRDVAKYRFNEQGQTWFNDTILPSTLPGECYITLDNDIYVAPDASSFDVPWLSNLSSNESLGILFEDMTFFKNISLHINLNGHTLILPFGNLVSDGILEVYNGTLVACGSMEFMTPLSRYESTLVTSYADAGTFTTVVYLHDMSFVDLNSAFDLRTFDGRTYITRLKAVEKLSNVNLIITPCFSLNSGSGSLVDLLNVNILITSHSGDSGELRFMYSGGPATANTPFGTFENTARNVNIKYDSAETNCGGLYYQSGIFDNVNVYPARHTRRYEIYGPNEWYNCIVYAVSDGGGNNIYTADYNNGYICMYNCYCAISPMGNLAVCLQGNRPMFVVNTTFEFKCIHPYAGSDQDIYTSSGTQLCPMRLESEYDKLAFDAIPQEYFKDATSRQLWCGFYNCTFKSSGEYENCCSVDTGYHAVRNCIFDYHSLMNGAIYPNQNGYINATANRGIIGYYGRQATLADCYVHIRKLGLSCFLPGGVTNSVIQVDHADLMDTNYNTILGPSTNASAPSFVYQSDMIIKDYTGAYMPLFVILLDSRVSMELTGALKLPEAWDKRRLLNNDPFYTFNGSMEGLYRYGGAYGSEIYITFSDDAHGEIAPLFFGNMQDSLMYVAAMPENLLLMSEAVVMHQYNTNNFMMQALNYAHQMTPATTEIPLRASNFTSPSVFSGTIIAPRINVHPDFPLFNIVDVDPGYLQWNYQTLSDDTVTAENTAKGILEAIAKDGGTIRLTRDRNNDGFIDAYCSYYTYGNSSSITNTNIYANVYCDETLMDSIAGASTGASGSINFVRGFNATINVYDMQNDTAANVPVFAIKWAGGSPNTPSTDQRYHNAFLGSNVLDIFSDMILRSNSISEHSGMIGNGASTWHNENRSTIMQNCYLDLPSAPDGAGLWVGAYSGNTNGYFNYELAPAIRYAKGYLVYSNCYVSNPKHMFAAPDNARVPLTNLTEASLASGNYGPRGSMTLKDIVELDFDYTAWCESVGITPNLPSDEYLLYTRLLHDVEFMFDIHDSNNTYTRLSYAVTTPEYEAGASQELKDWVTANYDTIKNYCINRPTSGYNYSTTYLYNYINQRINSLFNDAGYKAFETFNQYKDLLLAMYNDDVSEEQITTISEDADTSGELAYTFDDGDDIYLRHAYWTVVEPNTYVRNSFTGENLFEIPPQTWISSMFVSKKAFSENANLSPIYKTTVNPAEHGKLTIKGLNNTETYDGDIYTKANAHLMPEAESVSDEIVMIYALQKIGEAAPVRIPETPTEEQDTTRNSTNRRVSPTSFSTHRGFLLRGVLTSIAADRNVHVDDIPYDISGYRQPQMNTVITPVFKTKRYIDVQVTNSEHGTVIPSDYVSAEGEEITVSYDCDEGYIVQNIKVNGTPLTSEMFFMPDEDVIITGDCVPFEGGITKFSLLGQNAIIDQIAGTIDVTVPRSIYLSNALPVIEYYGNAVMPDTSTRVDFSDAENNPIEYKAVYGENNEFSKTYMVTVHQTQFTNRIYDFVLAGKHGKIDQANKKITVTVPTGTDIRNLAPDDIAYSAEEITPGISAERDFSIPQEYHLATTGTTPVRYTVYVQEAAPNDAYLTEMIVSGYSGVIDEGAATVTFTVPKLVNFTDIIPSKISYVGRSVSPGKMISVDLENTDYTVTSVSGKTRTYDIIVNRISDNEAHIDTFKLAGETGDIDQVRKIITVTLEAGTNVTGIAPDELTYTGKSIYPQVIAEKDFSDDANPVTYTVIAPDNTEVTYTVRIKYTDVKQYEALLLQYGVNGTRGIINQDTRTVTLKFNQNADVTNAIPDVFVISDEATANPDRTMAHDYHEDFTYLITSKDGNKQTIYTVHSEFVTSPQPPVVEPDPWLNSEALLLQYEVLDYKGVIDQTARTVTLSFPNGVDVTNAVPSVFKTSFGATSNPTEYVQHDYHNDFTYTITSQDGLTHNTYTVHSEFPNPLSEDARIVEFSIDNHPGTIDQDNGIITVKLPSTYTPESISDKVPNITWVGKTIIPSDTESQNFNSPITYVVTAENPAVRKAYDVYVFIDAHTEDTPWYNITLKSDTHGTLKSTASRAHAGDIVEIWTMPNDGYELSLFTVDAENKLPDAKVVFSMPAHDVTAEAKFTEKPIYYDIIVSKPLNGTVTSTHMKALPGTNVTLVATPNSDYTLTSFIVDSIENVPNNTVSFEMPAHNVYASADFTHKPVDKPKYRIIPEDTEHGDINSSVPEAYEGEEVKVWITPDPGYKPDSFTVDDEEKLPLLEVVIKMPPHDVYVGADFSEILYKLIPTNPDHGTIVTSVPEAPEGEEVWVEIRPDDGYVPESFVVDGDEQLPAYKVHFKMPARDVYASASFTEVLYHIIVDQNEHGKVISTHEWAPEGEIVTITLKPDPGYRATSFDIDKDNKLPSHEYSFSMPPRDVTVTVRFTEIEEEDGFVPTGVTLGVITPLLAAAIAIATRKRK